MAKIGGTLVFDSIAAAFLLRMQVCLISGLVVAVPGVTLELWGFIEPALTEEERKPVTFLAPFSVLLFLAGAATGYASLPMAYGWMSSYILDVPGATLMQHAEQYILLTVKIILAFGIAFQLPLILLFLARIGVITAALMTTYWRHATVGISVLAAVLTPSNDPLTMLMMAVPMAGLYLLSIGLVRAFEPKADGTRRISLVPMLLISLLPMVILLTVGFWLYRSNLAGKADKALQTSKSPAASARERAEVDSLKQEIEALQKRVDALESQHR